MFKNLQFSSFDFIFLIVLLVGVLRGRKRGISEELLDVIQWIAIVVGAGFGYRYIGRPLANYTQMPIMLANILCYIIIGAIIAAIVKAIKRGVGEKLVKGDAFGRFEYYLGMLAGAIRFSCISIFILSIINANYSTPADRAATAKTQKDNFGSISFPTWASLQQTIFVESTSGKLIATNLKHVLIEPMPPGPARPGENLRERRERQVNEVIGK